MGDILKSQKIQIEVPALPPLGFRYDSEERPTIKRIKKAANINGDISEPKDASKLEENPANTASK
jgi:hypothetical protein